MNEPLDRAAAEAVARRAAADWGLDARQGLEGQPVIGGWRFHPIRGGDPTSMPAGTSDIAVGADGTVLRVPAGTTDALVARLLTEQ